MKRSTRRILHLAGSTLAVAGIFFVAARVRKYGVNLDYSSLNTRLWYSIAGFALISGLSNCLLARAWWNLLLQYHAKGRWQCALRVYGLSLLAKYVPGNVMHIASRQALGLAAGFKGWPLVKASAWELGLISVAGALFAVLVLPRFTDLLGAMATMTLLFCFALTAAAGISRYMGIAVARAFGLQLGFLAVSGCIFTGLLALQVNLTVSNAPLAIGAFIVAWLAGFLTPGAPAGIGVRELVLVLLLRGLAGEAELLVVVLLSRILTVVGDCLFFLFFSVTDYGKN